MENYKLQYAAHKFGAELIRDGGVNFRIWAPDASTARLIVTIDEKSAEHPANKLEGGWYECFVGEATAGVRYQWKLNDNLVVPDPASRSNPDGPHEPSEVTDPDRFIWEGDWKGRLWSEVVAYEMHIGVFTPEGTYQAAEAKLPGLLNLGITAIELLPISTFTGNFGWGYDGVLPYAPYHGYGTPDDLKHFIQTAHKLGLMVFLDVVYNHFGPDGNHLSSYASPFFSKSHQNPWGDSLNFDEDGSNAVREFFIGNAIYWVCEFRFDGLRFDAVHAIKDDSEVNVMDELAERVRAACPERHIHLVLENENNVTARLPPEGQFTAQWNDDFHHCLHVALTGEKNGYYGDFADRPVGLVARSLANGFLWEGSPRNNEGRREQRVEAKPQQLSAMVNYLSNHDQTGNRAFGERLDELIPRNARPVATALTLLTPATPMIFAGEEFGASTPFLYFADYCGELGEAVTKGRLEEFGAFAKRANGHRGELPHPCRPETFLTSKLDWSQSESAHGEAVLKLVSRLLSARSQHLTPIAGDLLHGKHSWFMTGEQSFIVRWRYKGGIVVELSCNLSPSAAAVSDRSRLPWTPLSNVERIYVIGSFGKDWWTPWSAKWERGREI